MILLQQLMRKSIILVKEVKGNETYEELDINRTGYY